MTNLYFEKAIIVVGPRGGKRHATPIGGERLGLTFCGRKIDNWPIDPGGPPDCSTCKRRCGL